MDTKLILLAVGAGAILLILVGIILELSSHGQSFWKKPSVLMVGFVVLAMGGAVAYCYISSVVDKYMVRQKYGGEIIDLCAEPKGVPNLANLPTTSSPWRVAVIEDIGTTARWHDQLPAERRANDKDSTNIIACVERQRQVIETCEYTSGQPIDRVQYYVDVSLFNAENYQMISTFQVWGSIPTTCPSMAARSRAPRQGDDPLGKESSDYFATFYNGLMQTVR